jgi:hypothetical protein
VGDPTCGHDLNVPAATAPSASTTVSTPSPTLGTLVLAGRAASVRAHSAEARHAHERPTSRHSNVPPADLLITTHTTITAMIPTIVTTPARARSVPLRLPDCTGGTRRGPSIRRELNRRLNFVALDRVRPRRIATRAPPVVVGRGCRPSRGSSNGGCRGRSGRAFYLRARSRRTACRTTLQAHGEPPSPSPSAP